MFPVPHIEKWGNLLQNKIVQKNKQWGRKDFKAVRKFEPFHNGSTAINKHHPVNTNHCRGSKQLKSQSFAKTQISKYFGGTYTGNFDQKTKQENQKKYKPGIGTVQRFMEQQYGDETDQ